MTDNGDISGYILYAKNEDWFRIAQLCVAEDFRGKGIAKELVDTLKERATTQKFITLRCRRDFPAHKMWPRLGFFALTEKEGRSRAGHILVQWCFTLSKDDQLDLFQEKTYSDALDVAIDAQILFNLYESTDVMTPSQALYENYSEDSFFLQITEETYNEIDRNESQERRHDSRNIAYRFPKIEYDRDLVEDFEQALKSVLSGRTESDISDIRQLAITASSETNIFVTEDQSLLQKADAISHLTGLQVLSPTQLIIQYETRQNRSYRQHSVIGNDLSWDKISSTDLPTFQYEKFLTHGERKGKLRERWEHFLSMSKSNQFECRLLRSRDDILAIRVIENDPNGCVIHLGRVAQCNNRENLESFLVADTVRSAVKRNINTVMIKNDSFTPNFMNICRRIGFQKYHNGLIKFCILGNVSREELMSIIRERCSGVVSLYDAMLDHELEESCSPVDLIMDRRNGDYFLVPIKPDYAMSLIDRLGPRDDLFGGDSRTLLIWDNVYYRSMTHHKVLKSASRILWYVSTPRKEVMAVSHLDRVEVGMPGELFKKYRKFGILDWPEIYRICHENTTRRIMALQFSHTFPLRRSIPLNELRKVCLEDNVKMVVQSPWKIPVSTFRKLYRIGFGNES